jgi:hypothetical protein
MANKKTRTYSFMADITLQGVVIEMEANSLDDALAKSKELKAEDFVEVLGGHNDSHFEIQGFWLAK